MFTLDATCVCVLVGLTLLRFGVPMLGIWLLGRALKRALPSQA
jgi:hypothetical protein